MKDIWDAPFPVIIGLNKSLEERWHIVENSSSAIIVLLDSGELIQNEQLPLKKLPLLGNLKEELDKYYKQFERKASYNKSAKRELHYTANEADASATVEIINKVSEAIQNSVLKNLPKYDPEIEIDLEDVKLKVRETASAEDEEFVRRFVETQMFANFVEAHYELST